MATTSATNAWAVGSYIKGNAQEQTLIEHWNGTRWSRVASPNVGGSSGINSLFAVAAISASNVWAVGVFNTGTDYRTLIVHWNGSHWTRVASPSPGGSSGNNALTGVAGVIGVIGR